MQRFAELMKTAGDETRLRIIRLVKQYPLNVSELTEILGFAQSGVSRHLGQLKKAGLILEQREGMCNFYYPVSLNEGDEEVAAFFTYLNARLKPAENDSDHIKLMEIIKRREAGTRGLNERLLEPGQSWQVWSRTLAALLPECTVADFGCGDGILSVEMARFASFVYSIDNNSKAIAQTEKLIARSGVGNISLLEESLEKTSIDAESIDIVFFSQSLHHLEDPVKGLAEAARVLVKGGRVLIMELAEHTEDWVREKLGHLHQGFSMSTLQKSVKQAGLDITYSEKINSGEKDTFQVILMCGVKSRA